MNSESIIIGGVELSVPGSAWYPCTECERPVALAPSSQALVRDKGIEPYCAPCAFAVKAPGNLVVFARVPKLRTEPRQ